MRLENCSEVGWVTLSKYWNTTNFTKKQAIMSVAWAQVKNPSKLGCGGPTPQEAHIISTFIIGTCWTCYWLYFKVYHAWNCLKHRNQFIGTFGLHNDIPL
jgi:hypothetical protein